MRAHAALIALVAAACASPDTGDGGPFPDGGPRPDAGLPDARSPDAGPPIPDAMPRCSVSIGISPAIPVAGDTPIVAIAVRGGATGFVTMEWRVTGPPGDVATRALDPDGLRISFVAPLPGPYIVGGNAMSGTMLCEVPPVIVNVLADDQETSDIRLSYVPLPGQDAPPQVDREVMSLRGGADYALPAARILERGTPIAGTLNGPEGGLAAYLRVDRGELFADAAGKFRGVVLAGSHDVLVVPYGAVPAQRFLGVQQLAAFAIDGGDEVSGRVLDASEQPVAGARVAVAAGDLPPLVASTESDGRFTTRVRAQAGPLSLSVVAPDGGRLAATGASFAAGATVEARLAEQALVPVALVARTSAGQALAGAVVTFSTAAAPGGSLTVGTASDAGAASFRRTVVSGVDGSLPQLALPAGRVSVAVMPPPGTGDVLGFLEIDGATPPPSVATAAPLAEVVTVTDRDGDAVVGARVIAVARGARGVGAGLASSATSGATGAALVGGIVNGMTYDVLVDPPPGERLARGRASWVGGTGGVSVVLGPAIELTGKVLLPSGIGQPGVRVEARLEGQPAVLAETISGAGGFFSLWLPDPGPKQR